MQKNTLIRDILIFLVMLSAGLCVIMNPVKKENAISRIAMGGMIPEEFLGWRSVTRDTAGYSDKWQSINELLVRTYYRQGFGLLDNTRIRKIDFVLEYSSDLRKNFSFHFPENCHRAGDNEVDFFPALDIEVEPGRHILGKKIYIKGSANGVEKDDKVVVYWLVIDKKQSYRTFMIKIDQMLSGALKRAKQGFLVRFDALIDAYSKESIKKADEEISGFVRDLYKSLSPEMRVKIFGEFPSR